MLLRSRSLDPNISRSGCQQRRLLAAPAEAVKQPSLLAAECALMLVLLVLFLKILGRGGDRGDGREGGGGDGSGDGSVSEGGIPRRVLEG